MTNVFLCIVEKSQTRVDSQHQKCELALTEAVEDRSPNVVLFNFTTAHFGPVRPSLHTNTHPKVIPSFQFCGAFVPCMMLMVHPGGI